MGALSSAPGRRAPLDGVGGRSISGSPELGLAYDSPRAEESFSGGVAQSAEAGRLNRLQ
jgi:hypothetical protein